MRRIEYSDINKFLVSIGLFLIGLAALLPYLYFKEDFGLYIAQDVIKKLSPSIQEVIRSKQEKLIIIQSALPWISGILFIIGIISTILGLIRWFKRQAKIDEKFDKELVKLELEIQSLTPEEKEEKVTREIEEIEKEEQFQNMTEVRKPSLMAIQNYLNIEDEVIKVFLKYQSKNFEILPQQKLGQRFYIDLLLKAKTKKFADRIVEIKYFKNRISLSALQSSITQLNNYVAFYKNRFLRKVVPVLIIVYDQNDIAHELINKYKNAIINYSKNFPSLKRLKIVFLAKEKIKEFNIRDILKR